MTDKKAKKGTNKYHVQCRKIWCEFYELKFGTPYYFVGVDGKKLNEIINGLKFKIGDKHYEDEVFYTLFERFIVGCYDITSSPNFKFLKERFNLTMINYYFNDAFNEIRERSKENREAVIQFTKIMQAHTKK